MATHTPFISKFGKELIEEGRKEGQREGRKETLQQTLLKLLDLRRITVNESQRAVVLACTDESLLDSWIERAVTATSAQGVFETSD
jgi:hypothetical protein